MKRRPDVRRLDGPVAEVLIRAGLDAALTGEYISALIPVAEKLLQECQVRSNAAGHWLCKSLAAAADSIDPAAIAELTGDVVKKLLIDQGMPRWAAVVVSAGVVKASELLVEQLIPAGQLALGLRVLAIMLCPNPDACPVGNALSVPVVENWLVTSMSGE